MTPTDFKNRPTPGPLGATPKAEAIRICPSCGTQNTSESRFCGGCAAPLKETLTATPVGGEARTVRASTVELARGNRLADRYEIIEELGRGGMGKVFKVFDHKVSEVIALKLIRPEISVQDKAIERFKNELKFTRKIAHRNICRMYDLGEADYVFYITMEYVAGEDLKRFVRRAGPLNAGKAVTIAGQICDGLAEAHRVGAVHRDLKPQNIMIDAEGNAKIMDFGIARFTEMDRMTGSGVMIGTPEYMSPEQAEMAEVDPRSDIYSLGVVLYEMVTGRVPFEGPTPLSLAMKHKMETPKNVREWNALIPPVLASIIARCLEKDPARRYQTAGELKAALELAERDFATGERSAPVAAVPAKKVKKEKTGGNHKAMPLVAAGIIIAAAVVVYFLFLRPTPVSLTPADETARSVEQQAGASGAPPAGVPLPTAPGDAKPGPTEVKTAAGEASKGAVPGAGEKAVETKPKTTPPVESKSPATETAKTVVPESKAVVPESKPDAAKTKAAEPPEKKPEAKPKTDADEAVKKAPASKSEASLFSQADRDEMTAAQERTVAARDKAFKGGHNLDSLFFKTGNGAQENAVAAAIADRIGEASCWFLVAEKYYDLCVKENTDRSRFRALLKHIDGLKEKALAAWKNVPGDPLFQEAETRSKAAEKNKDDEATLREYAVVACDYEKIRWMVEWTRKK